MNQSAPSLMDVLAQVPDPRARRGQRHPWTALLLLMVVALLSRANTQQAIARWGQQAGWVWLHRLGFTRRSGPRGPTVHRVLQQVSVTDLESHLGQWFRQVRAAWAHDVQLLRACCQQHALVLGQQAVPDTTNELGAIAPVAGAAAPGR
jgi:hypothetical protein